MEMKAKVIVYALERRCSFQYVFRVSTVQNILSINYRLARRFHICREKNDKVITIHHRMPVSADYLFDSQLNLK